MDQPLPLSPRTARPSERRATPHYADAFDTLAAWRPPEPRHPRSGPANDWGEDQGEPLIEWRWGDPIPANVIAVGGAVFFAVLGAMFGNAMQL